MRTPDPGSTGEPLTVIYDTGDVGPDRRRRRRASASSSRRPRRPRVRHARRDVRRARHPPPPGAHRGVDRQRQPARHARRHRHGAAPRRRRARRVRQRGHRPEARGRPRPAPDPIVADVSIFGLPEHMRMRMANRLLDEDLPTEREAFERAEFHACSWDFDAATPGCTDAEGRIDAIDFGFRNFLTGDPLPPLLPETPLWVTVVGRGGARADRQRPVRGQGPHHRHRRGAAPHQRRRVRPPHRRRRQPGPVSAPSTSRACPIVFEEATGSVPGRLPPPRPRGDGHHRARSRSTSTSASSRRTAPCSTTPTAPFTAACQDDDPFGDDDGAGGVTRSPLALAYDGTNADGDAAGVRRQAPWSTSTSGGDADSSPDTPTDDQHVRGHVDVLHLPGTFSAYVDSPPDDADGNPTDGPLRVQYDANDAARDRPDHRRLRPRGDRRRLHLPRPAPAPARQEGAVRQGRHRQPARPRSRSSTTPTLLGRQLRPPHQRLGADRHHRARGRRWSRASSSTSNDPQTEDESDDTLETSVLVAHRPAPRPARGRRRARSCSPAPSTSRPRRRSSRSTLTVQNFIGPDPLPSDVPGPARRRARAGRGRPAVHGLPARRRSSAAPRTSPTCAASPSRPSRDDDNAKQAARHQHHPGRVRRPRPDHPRLRGHAVLRRARRRRRRPCRARSRASSATSRSSTCPKRSPSASAARRPISGTPAERPRPSATCAPRRRRGRLLLRRATPARALSCSTSTASCASPRPAASTCWPHGSTSSTSR